MKLLQILTLTICISTTASAQVFNGCDGQRYVDDVFDEVTVTEGVTFGTGITASGAEQQLMMDIYEPAGDQLEERPLLILAFGGSFISGARTDIDWLCEAYARKGYVAATIDYRIYDGPLFPIPDSTVFQKAVIDALSDMKASIRFMRASVDAGNTYQINPDNIIVGGISAGAIAAAHVAVLDSTDQIPEALLSIINAGGGFEGNSGENFEYSSEVAAFINYSGGLNDATWIDAGDPPFYSIHDEFDGTVPYGQGFATVFGIPIVSIDGSLTMQEVADSVGVASELYTQVGSTIHVSYLFSDDQRVENIDRTAKYLHNDLFCQDFAVSTDAPQLLTAEVYPNPTAGQIQLETLADHVVIYDMQGRLVYAQPYTPIVDLGSLADGMYHIRLLTNGLPIASTQVLLSK